MRETTAHHGETCTVGPRATTGERCGEAAVTAFVTETGERFAECARHAPPRIVAAIAAEAIGVGTVVTVEHIGVAKRGTVVAATATFVHVEVATYGGKARKVIKRRRTEVTV